MTKAFLSRHPIVSMHDLKLALCTHGRLDMKGGALMHVSKVQAEDGSGRAFNVTGMTWDGKTVTRFVRVLA